MKGMFANVRKLLLMPSLLMITGRLSLLHQLTRRRGNTRSLIKTCHDSERKAGRSISAPTADNLQKIMI